MCKILIKPKNQVKADYDILMVLIPFSKSYYNLGNYSKPLTVLVDYTEGYRTISKGYIAHPLAAEDIHNTVKADLYFSNKHQYYDYRKKQIFLVFETEQEYSKFKLSC